MTGDIMARLTAVAGLPQHNITHKSTKFLTNCHIFFTSLAPIFWQMTEKS
ncbi:MAG: hypothetical protein HDR89_03370 [Bacteroides sp.]|nr:hypothetical protein [Bacteroides sp.]